MLWCVGVSDYIYMKSECVRLHWIKKRMVVWIVEEKCVALIYKCDLWVGHMGEFWVRVRQNKAALAKRECEVNVDIES